MSFSIIIICRDEEKYIGQCIASIIGLSDDIIVIDTGSVDHSVSIIQSYPVKLLQLDWSGYGATKNNGASIAKYNWILSIDADEVVTKDLYKSLVNTTLNPNQVYSLRRINHIGDRAMRFGHLKPEIKPRLFRKNIYQWDDQPVHELLTPYIRSSETILLEGDLLHHFVRNIEELQLKYAHYAQLSDKTSDSFISVLGPIYYFIKSYILQLGILEGSLGLRLAMLFSQYKEYKNQP